MVLRSMMRSSVFCIQIQHEIHEVKNNRLCINLAMFREMYIMY